MEALKIFEELQFDNLAARTHMQLGLYWLQVYNLESNNYDKKSAMYYQVQETILFNL